MGAAERSAAPFLMDNGPGWSQPSEMRAVDRGRRSFGVLVMGAAASACIKGGRSVAAVAPPTAAVPSAPTLDPDHVVTAQTDPTLRMTAPVTVNGHGPYQFVVDTGANRSVISSELAAALELPPAGALIIHGVAGAEMVETVTAEHLAVSGLLIPGGRIPVLPAGRLGADGLLGVDGLGGRRLIMNFRQKSLTITINARIPGREPLFVEIPAKRRFGQLMIIDAAVEQTPVVAFLDSGAQSTVGNMALYNRIRSSAETLAPSRETLILSATDQTAIGLIGSLPPLRLGRLIVQTSRCAFADLHAFQLWDLMKKPAILIGMDLLRSFIWVEMDYARSVAGFRLDPSDMVPDHSRGDIGNQIIPFD